jgi:alpha-galactosidase
MSDTVTWRQETPNLWFVENGLVRCAVALDGGSATWSVQPRNRDFTSLGPMAMPAIAVDGKPLDYDGTFRIEGATAADGSASLMLEARSPDGTIRIRRFFEVFPGQPFVRTWAAVDNLGRPPITITHGEILNLAIASKGPLTLFHVDQFSWIHREDYFNTHEMPLVPGRAAIEVRMGAFPSHYADATSCAWAAVRAKGEATPGLAVGVEFNGKSRLRAWADQDGTHLASTIDALNHRLEGGGSFVVPACFVGLFQGDWDEAGYITHRFAETCVHPPAPDQRYPWVQYNTWGYGQSIHEAQQLEAIQRCARLGVEAVVMDLGWARAIGDWRADPAKFPRGLGVLADRVHDLGMKFGLHLALAQAAADSPVAREHPDWLIHTGDDYFGAAPLCLGHAPCRQWLIGEILRLVDECHVDYFVQDGEDMVKDCPRADHTHSPGDSNYSNSVEGLDAVIEAVRDARPAVVRENCEDGGCMLTYKMARLYHTSVTVDNIGTYATRQGVFGASYPFSLRYSVRYMQDAPTPYSLRSVIFGGPLILMQTITAWNEQQMAWTAAAIAEYKQLRGPLRDAKVIHLLAPRYNVNQQGWGYDAIQAVAPNRSWSVILAYRATGGGPAVTVHPRGLDPARRYRLTCADSGTTCQASGQQLREQGFCLTLAEMTSEKILLEAIE